MKERHNQILAGALTLQIILSVVLFWPTAPAAAGGEPLFPDLEVGAVVALTITDGDGASIALSQADGAWFLAEADAFPANTTTVITLLAKIVGLTSDRLVARSETSLSRLQVAGDDFLRRVDFQTLDGEEHTFYLGSSPTYGASHIRVEGQNETYLCDGISSWEASVTASSWIDAAYVSVAHAEIASLLIENAAGSFSFSKNEEGDWISDATGDEEIVTQTEVTSIVSQAGTVSIKEPLGTTELPGYGMETPLARITLISSDQTITLTIGAQDPDDSTYVVISSESDYYVRVHEYSVDRLVESVRDDFFEPLATPTPEPSATPEPTATLEADEEAAD